MSGSIGQFYRLGRKQANGLMELVPIETGKPIALRPGKYAVQVSRVDIGDQVIVGKTDELGFALAAGGDDGASVVAGAALVTHTRKAQQALRLAPATPELSVDGEMGQQMACTLVLDRSNDGDKESFEEKWNELAKRIREEFGFSTDTVRDAVKQAFELEPAGRTDVAYSKPSNGFVGGIAGALAVGFVFFLADKFMSTVFAKIGLLRATANIRPSATGESEATIVVADLTIGEGEGYALQDFGVDPSDYFLYRRGVAFPRRESRHFADHIRAPEPYVVFRLQAQSESNASESTPEK